MDFYLGLIQIISVHTLLGLSAYVVLQTGQVSLAQAGFMAIGAYVAAMLTVLAGWWLVAALIAGALVAGTMACLVGFPRCAFTASCWWWRRSRSAKSSGCSSSTSTTRSRAGASKSARSAAKASARYAISPRMAGRRCMSRCSSGSSSRWSWPRFGGWTARAPAPYCARSARTRSRPRAAGSTSPRSRSRR